MDFVEGLPKSEGYDAIMVFVDRLTKYGHFVPLRHPFTTVQVARAFWEHIIKMHGVPHSIVSDRDKIFMSAMWHELLAAAGTKLLYSTADYPQTDGQTERVNQYLEMYLRCAVHDTPRHWRKWLPAAEFWYNSAHHASLNCSSFKALYGREPNLGGLPQLSDELPSDAASSDMDWTSHTDLLRVQLERAQARFKTQANRHRAERAFDVGEQVLKLQPYSQSSIANHPCRGGQTEPVAILEIRMMRKGDAPVVQLLVQWANMPLSATTWEDYDVLRHRYPSTCILEGASSEEGGNDVPADATPTLPAD